MRQKLGGLSDIKTPQKAKVRSMPRTNGINYLDLFMLTKQKDRLEQEKYVVEKRKKNVEEDLVNITEQLSKAGVLEINPDKSRKLKETREKKRPKKDFKVMQIDY